MRDDVKDALTHTIEGWPLAKRGEEIVWRGVRWKIVEIEGDEMLIKAVALTRHRERQMALKHHLRMQGKL